MKEEDFIRSNEMENPIIIELFSNSHVQNYAVTSKEGRVVTFVKTVVMPDGVNKETGKPDNFVHITVSENVLNKELIHELSRKLKKLDKENKK